MDFRLILIDSFSPAREMIFPMEGRAELTGRNGCCKTALLQLLPVFFGENPNRIVGTETNRLNYAGYNLSRLTSYNLFEYRRRYVTCLITTLVDMPIAKRGRNPNADDHHGDLFA